MVCVYTRGSDARSRVFIEFFEHRSLNQPSGSRHRVMCLIPSTLVVYVPDNVEKVSLLKRQLLGSLWAVVGEGPDDFLWWRDRSGWFGHRGEWERCGYMVSESLLVFASIQRLA